jgi:hypothetical protein
MRHRDVSVASVSNAAPIDTHSTRHDQTSHDSATALHMPPDHNAAAYAISYVAQALTCRGATSPLKARICLRTAAAHIQHAVKRLRSATIDVANACSVIVSAITASGGIHSGMRRLFPYLRSLAEPHAPSHVEDASTHITMNDNAFHAADSYET